MKVGPGTRTRWDPARRRSAGRMIPSTSRPRTIEGLPQRCRRQASRDLHLSLRVSKFLAQSQDRSQFADVRQQFRTGAGAFRSRVGDAASVSCAVLSHPAEPVCSERQRAGFVGGGCQGPEDTLSRGAARIGCGCGPQGEDARSTVVSGNRGGAGDDGGGSTAVCRGYSEDPTRES
jgi:hypothetical protein